MASIDKLIRIVLQLEDQMSGGLGKASSSLQSFGGNLMKIGASLTALTAPLTGAGIAGVKLANELDTSMRNIQSITGQSDTEIAQFSKRLVDMSTDITKTVDSADELAKGLYNINSAGFMGEEGMKVLETATKAATAGLTDTAHAAEGIDAVLNAYNLTADDAAIVSDLMFTAVQRGVGTFDELTGAISNVVGTAKAAHQSFGVVTAAITTMSKSGMSFNEASIALNQTMLAFLKPSTDMAKVISDLGYESGEALLKEKGLSGALEAVSEATGGNVTQMTKLFGNVRALKGVLALTGSNADKFAQELDAMGQAAGATNDAFAAQTKSFEAQWKNFKNILDATLIDIGQTLQPLLIGIMHAIEPLLNGFRSLPAPVKTFIIVIGALVAALGPLLIIIGSVISAIGTIGSAISALGGMSAIISGLGSAFTLLTGPIGIVIAAVGALVLAWQTDFLGIRTFTQNAINGIKSWLEQLPPAVQQTANAVAHPLTAMNEAFRTLILGDAKGNQILTEDSWIVKALLGIRNRIIQFGQDIANVGLFEAMKKLGQDIINGLNEGVKNAAVNLIATVFGLSDDMKNTLKRAFGIASPSKVMAKLGKNVVEGFHQGIADMGGIGVQVPNTGGSTNSQMPTIGAGVGGLGGVTIVIQNLNVPLADNKKQIDYIADELGKRIKRRGGIG